MSGLGELQTVSALLDVIKLAYQASKFLKKVRNADALCSEIYDEVARLQGVLNSIFKVIESRDEYEESSKSDDYQVVIRVRESVLACGKALSDLEDKLGGFDVKESNSQTASLTSRVKIAFNHPSIRRIQRELRVRLSIMQTDLAVLQLLASNRNNDTLVSNQNETRQTLSDLAVQFTNCTELLYQLRDSQGQTVGTAPQESKNEREEIEEDEEDRKSSIESLEECIREAQDVHERYTSEHFPDDRSEKLGHVLSDGESVFHSVDYLLPRSVLDSSQSDRIDTPSTYEGDPLISVEEEYNDDETKDDVWPLELLDKYIDEYHQRAEKECEAERFHQAEVSLSSVIKYSEQREMHYGPTFDDRVQIEEKMALIYQKQNKWGDAVAKLRRLLGERSSLTEDDAISTARQNQLLASIFYERYLVHPDSSLSGMVDDIEYAERYARRALKLRWDRVQRSVNPTEDTEKRNECIQLLIQILETRNKQVEATTLNKCLPESLRRPMTAQVDQNGDASLTDARDIFIEAVKNSNTDQIQTMLDDKIVDLDGSWEYGQTPLMYAVIYADQSTLNKLLGYDGGGSIDKANHDGLTALHYAAGRGQYDFVKRLLENGADVGPSDVKGETPLVKAVRAKDIEMVRIFYVAQESALQTKSSEDWSLLHQAVRKSTTDITHLLLDLSPDLKDATDQAGKTALHHCAELENHKQASALLEHRHNPDVNAVDSALRSPLYLAASKPPTFKREKMVRLLLEHGAQVDKNKPPPRMRHYAAFNKSRRDSGLSRASITTDGTNGTSSTGFSIFPWTISRRITR